MSYGKIFSKIIILGLFFLLAGCSKINQANFEQVKPGMSMAQVIKILGEPSSVESINIAGISGTSANWKSRDAIIVIQFFNDQVGIKSFSKAGKNNAEQNTEINLGIPSSSTNSNSDNNPDDND